MPPENKVPLLSSPIPHSRVSPSPIGSSVIKALLADGTFTPRAVTRNTNSEKALKLKQLGAEVVQGDLWNVASLKNAIKGSEGVFGVIVILFARYHEPEISLPRLLIIMTRKIWPKAKRAKRSWESIWWTPQLKLVSNFSSGGKSGFWSCRLPEDNFGCFSSLPNCAKASYGKYPNVHHFDSEFIPFVRCAITNAQNIHSLDKADIDDYLRASRLPHAILRLGMSMHIPSDPITEIYVGWFLENTTK